MRLRQVLDTLSPKHGRKDSPIHARPRAERATSVHIQFSIEAVAKVMIARVIAPDSQRL